MQLSAIWMQKLSLIEGLKNTEAVNKEALADVEQMHIWDNLKPVLPGDLYPQRKINVLEPIMSLKEK